MIGRQWVHWVRLRSFQSRTGSIEIELAASLIPRQPVFTKILEIPDISSLGDSQYPSQNILVLGDVDVRINEVSAFFFAPRLCHSIAFARMSIRVKQARRVFGGLAALDGISSDLADGTVVAVLGANGAGKSTLLRLIAGWLPLSSGRIEIDGYRVAPNRVAARRKLLLLDEPKKHDASVLSTIAKIITEFQVDRAGIEDEVAEWMERLDLVGLYNKRSREVSKGQRYKVAMIGLFVVRPKVWLLDEPFSCGLDAGGLHILEQQIRHHASQGGIVAFSSQWPEHAVRLADQAIVLHGGSVVYDGDPKSDVASLIPSDASPALSAVMQGLRDDG